MINHSKDMLLTAIVASSIFLLKQYVYFMHRDEKNKTYFTQVSTLDFLKCKHYALVWLDKATHACISSRGLFRRQNS